MAKWVGKIGFAIEKEIRPTIWEEEILERRYLGKLEKNSYRSQSSGNVIDNLTISNLISIVADPFAIDNSHVIRYAEFRGTKWKVSNVEIQSPRLILTLGDVYHG